MTTTRFCFCIFSFCLAYAGGRSDECLQNQYEAMELRKGAMSITGTKVATSDLGSHIDLYSVDFQVEHQEVRNVLTYSCKNAGSGSYPAYRGFAWLVVMPATSTFSIVDHQTDGFFRDTTIEAIVEKESDLLQADDVVVLVSGPFWKLGQRGEMPIGAIVVDREVRNSYLTGFSAKYVLCSTSSGVGLLAPSGEETTIKKEELTECSAAVQVGPAFVEKRGEGTVPGIGGNSMNTARRNILVRTSGVDGDGIADESGGHILLFSTMFDIGVYDAMAAIYRALDVLGGETQRIAWAVGLVDDESLGGPVIVNGRATTIHLAETSRPTGAILRIEPRHGSVEKH